MSTPSAPYSEATQVTRGPERQENTRSRGMSNPGPTTTRGGGSEPIPQGVGDDNDSGPLESPLGHHELVQ